MALSLSCVSCQETFYDSQALYNHRRVHQQRVHVRLADGSQQDFEATSDGSFVCLCGLSFDLARQMQRHAAGQCTLLKTVSCEVVRHDNACDLVSTKNLTAFKLAVNTKHGVLVCLSCGIILSNLANHLSKKAYYKTKEDVARINADVSEILSLRTSGK